MSANKEELLDVLIGMAQHVGSLSSKAAAADHRADMAPRGQTRQPRREARHLHKLLDIRLEELARTRARFLADMQAGGSARQDGRLEHEIGELVDSR